MAGSDPHMAANTSDSALEAHNQQLHTNAKAKVDETAVDSSSTTLRPFLPQRPDPAGEASCEARKSGPVMDKSPSKDASSDEAAWNAKYCWGPKFRGTDTYVNEIFLDYPKDDMGDPELHDEIPVLLPPVQPAGTSRRNAKANPRPLWGLKTSSGSGEIFSHIENSRQEIGDETGVSPVVDVDERIHATVERFHELKRQGIHYNEELMKNRSFNNPHVYSQLVDLLDIDETRSNLPSLDTGRVEGSWRSIFPLKPEERIEGDPIAIEQRQKEEAERARASKLRAGSNRTIHFDRGRYPDNAERPSKRRSSGEEPLHSSSTSASRSRAR